MVAQSVSNDDDSERPAVDAELTPDVTEEVLVSLLRVINKIQLGRRTTHSYGENGIPMTLVEAEMCALINRNQGITGGELSTLLGVTRSATSQVISKLKARGFVVDMTHPGDAKRRRLYLTDQGKMAADVADQYSELLVSRLFEGVSSAEIAAYLKVMRNLESFHDEISQRKRL